MLNSKERIELMALILKTGASIEWLKGLDAADVPCAPVLRHGAFLNNVQIVATQLIQTLDQPNVGRVRQTVPAAQFEQTPVGIGGAAPGTGEHMREKLESLGLEREAI